MSLESGLSLRDPQEFSLSQLAAGGGGLQSPWASPSAPLNTLPTQAIHFGKSSHPPPNKLLTQLFLAELDC